MTRSFLWFVVGVLTAIAMFGAYSRMRERREEEDIDALADSISEKLDRLEASL